MNTKLSQALPDLKRIAETTKLKLNRVHDLRVIIELYKRQILLHS